jgi:hypothetical protein
MLSLNLRLGDLIFISSMKFIQHHQNIYATYFFVPHLISLVLLYLVIAQTLIQGDTVTQLYILRTGLLHFLIVLLDL